MKNYFSHIPQNELLSIFIYVNEDEYFIQSCHLKKQRGKIAIIDFKEFSLDEHFDPKQLVDGKIPMVVGITGPNIIYKNSTEPFDMVFPNIERENFLIQEAKFATGNLYGVMRKDDLHTLMSKIGMKENRVLSFSLIPDYLVETIQLLDSEKSEAEMKFQNFSVSYHNGAINTINYFAKAEYNGRTYKMGSDEVKGAYFISFSLAFSYLIAALPQAQIPSFNEELALNYWGAIRLEKLILKIGLPFILVLSLVVAMLFNRVNSTNQALTQELSVYNQYFNTYNRLQKNLATKQEMISEIGWTNKEHLIKMVNVVTETIPATIKLTSLFINPYDVDVFKKQTVYEYKKNIIQISGQCTNAAFFSEWVAELNKQSWIKEVRDPKYQYDNFAKTGKFYLIIEVAI